MTGKGSKVSFDIDRMVALAKKRGIANNKTDLGKVIGEEGFMSERQFIRDYKEGTMSIIHLENCAELLKPCSVDYLRGKEELNNNVSGFFTEEEFREYKAYMQSVGNELDDKGNIIGKNEWSIRDKALPHFCEFMRIIYPLLDFKMDVNKDGNYQKYSFVDYVQQVTDFFNQPNPSGKVTESNIKYDYQFVLEMDEVIHDLQLYVMKTFRKTYALNQKYQAMTPEQFSKEFNDPAPKWMMKYLEREKNHDEEK